MLFENNFPYSLIKALITVIGSFGMICTTSKFRYDMKKVICIISVFLVYVTVSTAAIIYFAGYLFFMRIFLFTISFPAIFLIYKLAKSQPARAVFNHATQILFSLYIAASITLLNTAINGTILCDFILRVIAYLIVILAEIMFLRKPFMRLISIARNGWGILSLVPCSLMLLSVTIAFYPKPYTQSPSSVVLIYLLGTVILIIYFAIFQYLSMQYQFQITSYNRVLLEYQVNNLKEKVAEDMAIEEKKKIDRHDARHKLQVLSSLIESGNTSAALDYINHFISFFPLQETKHYCKEPILNATLSSYLGQAATADIVLETYLCIPDSLPVDSAELSCVFANALENAIAYCRKLPKEQRKIICKCIDKPQLMLEISNPCFETIAFSDDGLPITEDEQHGIGTRSIAAFCRKNNAFYTFTQENGWFRLRIIF